MKAKQNIFFVGEKSVCVPQLTISVCRWFGLSFNYYGETVYRRNKSLLPIFQYDLAYSVLAVLASEGRDEDLSDLIAGCLLRFILAYFRSRLFAMVTGQFPTHILAS